jgi:hypothetical protein
MVNVRTPLFVACFSPIRWENTLNPLEKKVREQYNISAFRKVLNPVWINSRDPIENKRNHNVKKDWRVYQNAHPANFFYWKAAILPDLQTSFQKI